MPMCRFLIAVVFLAAAGSSRAEDTPLEGIPLPRAVTSFEHKLGVSDNELPGGKRSTDKGQFALSSYDQSILAHGPPDAGSGPAPASAPPPPPAQQAAPIYSYGQPAYAPVPAYAYAQQAYGQQQYGYPQYQGYAGYQQNMYQYPQQQRYSYPQYTYAYAQQPQVSPVQQPVQQGNTAGANYWDYSQANGKLSGANSDIASAAAFTDKGTNSYSNLGWHPTLEREMGVHKSERNKGPRLALKGQLKGMKNLAQPHMTISPSIDPKQVSVAAQKLEKAQRLLRMSVAKGLRLKSGHMSKIALGERNEDPCSTLACERARTDGGRHAMKPNPEQTLQASLAKHPVSGPDAKNPFFHDAHPPEPHPPPPHEAKTPKETAHENFDERFRELAGKGSLLHPHPHPPHGRNGGERRAAAGDRARRHLEAMHAASGRSLAAERGKLASGQGERRGVEQEGDTRRSVQKISAAHERLAAKARHGQALAARAHEAHHFRFPAYMVRNTGDEMGQGGLAGPIGAPRMKKIGPESSFAMGILLAVFIGLLVMAVVLGWMHARKERKRNEMVALSGFADD